MEISSIEKRHKEHVCYREIGTKLVQGKDEIEVVNFMLLN